MPNQTPTRRSTRARVPRKRSFSDGVEELNRILSSSSSSSGSIAGAQNPEDEDVFMSDAVSEYEGPTVGDEVPGDDEDEEEREEGNLDYVPGGDSEADEISTPSEDEGAGKAHDSARAETSPAPVFYNDRLVILARQPIRKTHVDAGMRSRGIEKRFKMYNKDNNMKFLYGTNEDDVLPVVLAKDKWINLVTLPSQLEDDEGVGGMHVPFSYTDEARERERATWEEWFEGQNGKEGFEKEQKAEGIGVEEGRKYLARSWATWKGLMGPIDGQKVYTIRLRESLSLAEVWKADLPEKEEKGTSRRYGWMLNIGAKTACMEWAPNHSEGTQYLAIAQAIPRAGDTTPFVPTEPYPANIQIWAFKMKDSETAYSTMDNGEPPSLVHVICTSWGSVRKFAWNPVTRKEKERDGKAHVGVLAVIFSDGFARVFDVTIDRGKQSQVFVKYTTAAISFRPPDTIPTCLAWHTPTSLLLGTAHGFVSIFLLPAFPPNPSLSVSSTPPVFHQLIHQSYITALALTHPLYPPYLLSTSVDGFTHLTDLRNPSVDKTSMLRNRLYTSTLSWHPHICAALIPEDHEIIRAALLRRFFSSLSVGRAGGGVAGGKQGMGSAVKMKVAGPKGKKSAANNNNAGASTAGSNSAGGAKDDEAYAPPTAAGEIRDVCAAWCHACVLVSATDGSIGAFNPMRRIFSYRTKGRGWTQMWFKHEWMAEKRQPSGQVSRGRDNGRNETSVDNEEGGMALRQGISRISEGYLPRSTPLGLNTEPKASSKPNTSSSKAKGKRPARDRATRAAETPVSHTIYEEQTAVDIVVWNPNVRTGGWAAAGCGSGVVRVEDLAFATEGLPGHGAQQDGKEVKKRGRPKKSSKEGTTNGGGVNKRARVEGEEIEDEDEHVEGAESVNAIDALAGEDGESWR